MSGDCCGSYGYCSDNYGSYYTEEVKRIVTSKEDYGEVDVILDKNYYNPGEEISGSVYIDCIYDFKATRLLLMFEGKENILTYKSGDIFMNSEKKENAEENL